MVIQMPGKGAQYLGGITDADGDYLAGDRSYQLHVPANVPVQPAIQPRRLGGAVLRP
jgi:hypothetical protein